MRRLRYAFVPLAFVLFVYVAHAEVSVFFSPRGGCDKSVIRVAQSAQMYLDAACYTFTLSSIGDELIAAKKRGVNVRVILDRMSSSQGYSQLPRLLQAGIPVRVNAHEGLMHNKFIIADGKNLATGSFNWTQSAMDRNDENVLLFWQEPSTANLYAAQFERMWADTIRFGPSALDPVGVIEPEISRRVTQAKPSDSGTVFITKTGARFHAAGCRSLRRSSIAISRSDAEKRGYSACSICKP